MTDAKRPRLGIFNGLKLYLHPAALSKSRRTIFERQIASQSGNLLENLDGDGAMILIDTSLMDLTRQKSVIEKVKDQNKGKKMTVISLKWLSECIKKCKLMDVRDYLIEEIKNDTSEHDSEEKGIFEGLNIYLHPSAICESKRSIFERRIVSRSGNLLEKLDGDGAIVLIDTDYMDKAGQKTTIENIKDQNKGKKMSIASLKWLSECIKEDKLMDVSDYLIKTLKDGFVCNYSSEDPSKPKNHNKVITDELEKLAQAYKNSNDKWRCFGYEKAINAIKRHPKLISSREEAATIRGVGSKMAYKVEEILNSGKLRKVSEVCEDERAQTLDLFNRVWGAGPITAESWYQQGFRTLEDLKEKAKLTNHQKVGLKHFQELDERMERSEAQEIEKVVKEHAEKIAQGLEITGCGSYRRGKPTCGDLDVLITHKDDRVINSGLFAKLLESMRRSGFLTDDLTVQENGKKYLGVCKLPGAGTKHRRLDIIVVPFMERATALMYFTGSAHFNRSMRLLAIKMGMSLSEHSLKKDVLRHNKEKVNEGCILPTPTEESVFEHLGLEYRPPNERDH